MFLRTTKYFLHTIISLLLISMNCQGMQQDPGNSKINFATQNESTLDVSRLFNQSQSALDPAALHRQQQIRSAHIAAFQAQEDLKRQNDRLFFQTAMAPQAPVFQRIHIHTQIFLAQYQRHEAEVMRLKLSYARLCKDAENQISKNTESYKQLIKEISYRGLLGKNAQIAQELETLKQLLAIEGKELVNIEKNIASERTALVCIELEQKYYEQLIKIKQIQIKIASLEKIQAYNNQLIADFKKQIDVHVQKYIEHIKAFSLIQIRQEEARLTRQIKNLQVLLEATTKELNIVLQQLVDMQKQYNRFDGTLGQKIAAQWGSFLDSENDKTVLASKIKAATDDVAKLRQKLIEHELEDAIVEGQRNYVQGVLEKRKAQDILEFHQIQDFLSKADDFKQLSRFNRELLNAINLTIFDKGELRYSVENNLTQEGKDLLVKHGISLNRLEGFRGNAFQAHLHKQLCSLVNQASELLVANGSNQEVQAAATATLQVTAQAMDMIQTGTPYQAVAATGAAHLCMQITDGIANVTVGTIKGIGQGIKDNVQADFNLVAHPQQTLEDASNALARLGSISLRILAEEPTIKVEFAQFCVDLMDRPLEQIVQGIVSGATSMIAPTPFSTIPKLVKSTNVAKVIEKVAEKGPQVAGTEQKIAHAAQAETKVSAALQEAAGTQKPSTIAAKVGNVVKVEELLALADKLDKSVGNIPKLKEAIKMFKDIPGVIKKDAPIVRLLENGFEGASAGKLSTARGAAYELEKAYDLINKEGPVLSFGSIIQGKEFDLIFDHKMIECKNVNWLKTDIDRFKSDIVPRAEIAKNIGRKFELHSKQVIPESLKLWLESKNISYFEG